MHESHIVGAGGPTDVIGVCGGGGGGSGGGEGAWEGEGEGEGE